MPIPSSTPQSAPQPSSFDPLKKAKDTLAKIKGEKENIQSDIQGLSRKSIRAPKEPTNYRSMTMQKVGKFLSTPITERMKNLGKAVLPPSPQVVRDTVKGMLPEKKGVSEESLLNEMKEIGENGPFYETVRVQKGHIKPSNPIAPESFETFRNSYQPMPEDPPVFRNQLPYIIDDRGLTRILRERQQCHNAVAIYRAFVGDPPTTENGDRYDFEKMRDLMYDKETLSPDMRDFLNDSLPLFNRGLNEEFLS